MSLWRAHTLKPTGPEVALIAVFDDENRPFLLPEIYRWSEAHGNWIGYHSGLHLTRPAFMWVPEREILETIE